MADLLRRANEVPDIKPSGLTYEEKILRCTPFEGSSIRGDVHEHERLEVMYPKLKDFFTLTDK